MRFPLPAVLTFIGPLLARLWPRRTEAERKRRADRKHEKWKAKQARKAAKRAGRTK